MNHAAPTDRRSLLRRAGLGRLLYLGYHAPARQLRECRRVGLRVFLLRLTADARMRAAARRLGPIPDLPTAPANWPAVRFLTGRKFWQQTVFCARSLELASGVRPRFEFQDDGTFDDALVRTLRRLFPGSGIHLAPDCEEKVRALLPPERYPGLHSVRRLCKYHRKLFDLRAGRSGWSLYLDSDMLFHERPDELLGWMDAPASGRFLHDRIESYCPNDERLERAAGASVLRHVNAGLLACRDEDVDWDFLERFASRVPEACHADRAFEQTLSAVFMSRIPGARALDPDRYRVVYDEFSRAPSAALLHYCWHSNLVYKEREWRRVAESRRLAARRRP